MSPQSKREKLNFNGQIQGGYITKEHGLQVLCVILEDGPKSKETGGEGLAQKTPAVRTENTRQASVEMAPKTSF